MECLAALCLYASAYIGQHNFDAVGPMIERNGRYIVSPSEHLANVTIGAQFGRFFVELDHTSDPTTLDDRGWEEIRIGYRKTWGFNW